jgi:hypothetical protein
MALSKALGSSWLSLLTFATLPPEFLDAMFSHTDLAVGQWEFGTYVGTYCVSLTGQSFEFVLTESVSKSGLFAE